MVQINLNKTSALSKNLLELPHQILSDDDNVFLKNFLASKNLTNLLKVYLQLFNLIEMNQVGF